MPYKIPNSPSPRAHPHELADFAEVQAWLRGEFSQRDVQRQQSQLDDNIVQVGLADPEDDIEQDTDHMINEVESREKFCGRGYPFELLRSGSVIRCSSTSEMDEQSLIYLFLLLATRFDMRENRIHADLDGTELFEKLSAEVLQAYLGFNRAKSMVFGTASGNQFESKINDLCEKFGEGRFFQNPDSASPTKNDDALDVVAWIPFSDKRSSKISIFAQCKTGTSWPGHTGDLRPDDFINTWMSGKVSLNPIRSFFVTEAVNSSYWISISNSAGLFFDRCRIVDFATDLSDDLLVDIKSWTLSAKATL